MTPPSSPRKVTLSENDLIWKMYEDGLSPKEIAEKFAKRELTEEKIRAIIVTMKFTYIH